MTDETISRDYPETVRERTAQTAHDMSLATREMLAKIAAAPVMYAYQITYQNGRTIGASGYIPEARVMEIAAELERGGWVRDFSHAGAVVARLGSSQFLARIA